MLIEKRSGIDATCDASTICRREAIARLWVKDGVFIDPDTRYQGYSGITLAADGVAKKFPTFVFTELGEIVTYHGGASSIGASVPLERKPLSLAATSS